MARFLLSFGKKTTSLGSFSLTSIGKAPHMLLYSGVFGAGNRHGVDFLSVKLKRKSVRIHKATTQCHPMKELSV
ncbi:MAG: hypothetical protein ACRC3K_03240, partial [Plesiomonas sp.]